MTRAKKILIFVLAMIMILLLLFAWYQYEYSMEYVETYEVNDSSLNRNILIATQGSEFKDAITANIINKYKKNSVSIKVIDVSYLSEVNPENYKALVIMHTWENWKPPLEVARFINRVGARDNMVVLTTSGQGDYKMEDVDAITGESKPDNIIPFTDRIIEKIDKLVYINSN